MKKLLDRVKHSAPLLNELYWTSHYLISGTGSPYLQRGKMVADWLRQLDSQSKSLHHNGPRVLVFAALPFLLDQIIATAIVLAGRECLVDVIWVPFDDFTSNRTSMERRFTRWANLLPRHPLPVHPRVRFFNIRDLREGTSTAEMHAIADRIARFDLAYLSRKERIDASFDKKANDLYKFRYRRNLSCLRRVDSFLKPDRYDSILTVNGLMLEFGSVYEMARLRGINCATFEDHERRGYISAAQNTAVAHLNMDHLWELRKSRPITSEQKSEMYKRLKRRADTTAFSKEYTWNGQSAEVEPHQTLFNKLNLNPNLPCALLCTNISWDSAVLGRARAFRSMAEWIQSMATFFANRPDWQLIIRAHPAEATQPSNEPVSGILEEKFAKLPSNVKLILPGDPINTYGLIPISKVALIYTSTMGIETVVLGLPTLVAGRTHYVDKGFTIDPKTEREYLQTLTKVLGDPNSYKPTQATIDMALNYFYVYQEEWAKPYPWHVATFNKDITQWPISRVLSDEGIARYGKTFDFLGSIPTSESIDDSINYRKARTG